ncbi:hypothetical protein DY000_02043042 [Brassica cretica]|uniref:Uncharacterized protein n=1 Tax=Brassica cretica TaxID=69181 RepID=A0ABQ7B7H2_BRACR|nr:hypothetical protein DY000_02043042 [Brassica cretica]
MQALKAIILLLMNHRQPGQVAMICSSSNIHHKDNVGFLLDRGNPLGLVLTTKLGVGQ